MIKIQNQPPQSQQPGQWPAQPQYQQQPYQQQYQQPYPQQYPQQQQPMQPPMQQPGVPKKNNTMMIVAVIAVVAIVVVAVLAIVLMRGSPMTIQITNWDTDQSALTILSDKVTFTVDLRNTGTTTSTGVVTCKLALSVGGTITNTQSVTLGPGATTQINVVVTATSMLQWAALSTGTPTCTIA